MARTFAGSWASETVCMACWELPSASLQGGTRAKGPLEGGAGGCWRPPRRCGHPGAGCTELAQLWGLRMACQGAETDGRPCPRHSRPREPAQATVLQTHTARRPRGRPRGAQEPAPRPPRQLLSSPPLGRHPGLWVTGGVRWRSLTPEHHGSDAETSPSNSAQLRSYIKKWGF